VSAELSAAGQSYGTFLAHCLFNPILSIAVTAT